MIRETIVVKYIISKEDGTVTLSSNLGEHEYLNEMRIFHQFKNNGQVSKSDCSEYDVVNREAERLLKERLELKASKRRANKLGKIIARRLGLFR